MKDTKKIMNSCHEFGKEKLEILRPSVSGKQVCLNYSPQAETSLEPV
jgi:hypothetical protein